MYLLHKIYVAQIGAFVNNAVEVGEEDGKPLLPPCTKFRVFSISATLLNEKFVLPERMRLTY